MCQARHAPRSSRVEVVLLGAAVGIAADVCTLITPHDRETRGGTSPREGRRLSPSGPRPGIRGRFDSRLHCAHVA